MDKKLKKDIEDISTSLGLGVEVDCFLDNQPRTAYPVTLKDYPLFASYIGNVDPKNIASAFFIDNGEGLRNMITLVFGADKVDEILENVDSSNFNEFMDSVFKINGIILKNDEEKQDKKK